jgi:DNA-binding NarL/FixJ family response regulator
MDSLESIGKNELRVAVVEDHPQLCDVLKRMIKAEPGLVCCGEFLTGEDTLRRIAEINPDIVTLDLSLPDTSGLGVLEMIKQICPATKCIFFSGYTDEGYVRQALEAGAFGYLYKEDISKLVNCIRQVGAGKICVSERFESVAAQCRTTNS